MSAIFVIVMIAVAVAIVLSVIVIHACQTKAEEILSAPAPEEAEQTTLPTVPKPFSLPPPQEGSVRVEELEIGQKIVLRTAAAKYTLTLREPVLASFDAVREGPEREGGPRVKKAFILLLDGTYVPFKGFYARWFIQGGTIVYKQIEDLDSPCYQSRTTPLRALYLETRQAA